MVARYVEWFRDSPIRMIGAGVAALVLVVAVVAVCSLSGGNGEDVDLDLEFVDPGLASAPPPTEGLSESEVELRVLQTLQAQEPTPTLEPTPDIPSTMAAVAEAEATRVAETSMGMGGVGFEATREAGMVGGEQFVLSVSDERFLSGMGPPIWYSVRIHLELEDILDLRPEEFVNSDDTRLVLEWMEYDVDRALRDIQGLDSLRDSATAAVRAYGNYVEDMVVLVRESVSLLRAMYQTANEREEFMYSDLTPGAQAEINAMYWDAKQNLADFDRQMRRYGCSVCGELYRGRAEN